MLAKSLPDDLILYEYATRWSFMAHPGQIPPRDRDWYVYLMRSGRGGGKTRAGSEWVLSRVREGARMIALVGETKADVRDVMIELGPSSIMRVARPYERPVYEPSKRRLSWPNGAVAIGFSGDEPDQLRGYQFDTAWIDELAKFRYPSETWDNLMFCMRAKNTVKPRVFVTTTPRPIPLLRELVKQAQHRDDVIDVCFSTYQNLENLSPAFVARIKQYEGTRLGRQEIHGEIIDDVQGALWKYDIVENLRVKAPPTLQRIVVAVDPAVTCQPGSDETGIIVAGLGVDGHAYVLDDMSGVYTPVEWARRTLAAFDRYKADHIIAEVNNGGDLVKHNLETLRRNIPYKPVHATRGKLTRAEPVASLYEQGRVHHVGAFPVLEDQLCTWVQGEKSPDRLDALVWALTELMLDAPAGAVYAVSSRRGW